MHAAQTRGGGGRGRVPQVCAGVHGAGPACAPDEVLAPAAGEPAAQKGVRLWEGGPLWADRNVGADEPWEPGYYFWWGDTVGYT